MPYEVTGELLCWTWTGYCDHEGTPKIRTPKGQTTARRYYFEREKGPIPEGLILYALCQNPRCVRPHHMQPVTWAEWNRRKGLVVLSPREAARALLMRHNGISRREVARRLGVSEPTIKEIEDGTHWTVRKEGRDGTAPARLAAGRD